MGILEFQCFDPLTEINGSVFEGRAEDFLKQGARPNRSVSHKQQRWQ